jgi:phenylalanyl-tRNA synthetase beta chain
MLIDDEIPVAEIEAVFNKNRGNILESYSLFDVYKGSQIEAGKKSVAYSITFRAKDKTLTDEEVTIVMNKILDDLKSKLNAELRG